LIAEPDLRQRLAGAARERARRLFSRERFIERFTELVEPHTGPLIGNRAERGEV
jgi:glycosyltransferase involved in cell wall biosynthesis